MTVVNTNHILRASISTSGVGGDGASYLGAMSSDGRFIAFRSQATNLTSDPTGNLGGVFLRDTLTGVTKTIAIGFDGSTPGGGGQDVGGISVSDDGRYVTFTSDQTNLVDGDTNGAADAFIRDTWTGATTRVSADGTGDQLNGASNRVDISADGRFVAFRSLATNAIEGATGLGDVYVQDMLTAEVTLASSSSSGAAGNNFSTTADISADGRYVFVESFASNLVANDTNQATDVFRKDMLTGAMIRVSVGASGVQGSSDSFDPAASADGRYVVFTSFADNLVPGDENGATDIFLRDIVAGTTKRVSVGLNGAEAVNSSAHADVSDDGRYVVFESDANNLVTGDANGATDIFVRDTVAGTTIRVSVGLGGREANGLSSYPTISGDGRYVTFSSDATNIASGDGNASSDVFRVTLGATDDPDNLVGSAGSDIVNGLGGGDVISGGAGADTLDGGTGADKMTGGSGDDFFFVDNAGDRIVEATGGGTDSVAVKINYALAAGVEAETLRTTSTLGTTSLTMVGNEFGQTIIGNAGVNAIYGRGGADILTGLGGADSFVFDTALSPANVDKITDFAAGVDKIKLDHTIFTLLPVGALAATAFKDLASAPIDSNDRILYSHANGALFYDVDGSGSQAARQIAVLTSHPTISASDFAIIA